jgi:hypothetical protein
LCINRNGGEGRQNEGGDETKRQGCFDHSRRAKAYPGARQFCARK